MSVRWISGWQGMGQAVRFDDAPKFGRAFTVLRNGQDGDEVV